MAEIINGKVLASKIKQEGNKKLSNWVLSLILQLSKLVIILQAIFMYAIK